VTGTPAILIPSPYAAEDHRQSWQLVPRWYFASGGPQVLESKVSLLHSPGCDAIIAGAIAVPDSAERLALLRQLLEIQPSPERSL